MPGAALARQKPVVFWMLPHTTGQGTPIPFTWTARHLGRNHHLVVQRPVGTVHVWKTMMTLPSNSGVSQFPGLSLGKYRYSIADLRGRRVLTQHGGCAVFGPVPLTTLFGGGPERFYANPMNSTYATPTHSFSYVEAWPNGATPAFTVEHNPCLSVHMGFVLGNNGSGYPESVPGAVGTVTVVQGSRDPVSASAPYNAMGSLDADLVLDQT